MSLWLPPLALALSTSPPVPMERLSALFQATLPLQEPALWSALQDPKGNMPSNRFGEIAANAHAAPSARHGMGAFASVDLPVDAIASLYPVHSLGLGSRRVSTEEDGEHFAEPCTTAYRTQLLHEEVQEWAPGAYIDANPHRDRLDGWLAHLANDGAVCSDEAGALRYLEESALLCNCALLPLGTAAPLVALVTTRAVEQGEELLAPYGVAHWVGQAGGAPPPPAASDLPLSLSSPAAGAARAAAARWRDGAEARVAAEYAFEFQLLGGLLLRARKEAEGGS